MGKPVNFSAPFVALDFETANYYPNSACALALVRVENGLIIDRKVELIRPPDRQFAFTWLHGIAWDDVVDKPSFADLWPQFRDFIKGAKFLAAHNASFDRGVLRTCCFEAGITQPRIRFVCTMKLAREKWNIYPTRLPDVCGRFGIPLNHHDPLSDAEACARIIMQAREESGVLI
ncbi:DNA polymerase III epsilon subunit-like 3'-5' exonuclease (fragment) [Candidatus Zixiibacteriota bacterium]